MPTCIPQACFFIVVQCSFRATCSVILALYVEQFGALEMHYVLQTAARGTFGAGMGAGARLGTAARMGTAARGRMGMPSSMGRPVTGVIDSDSGPRPMTAIKGVGFTSSGNRGTVAGFVLMV